MTSHSYPLNFTKINELTALVNTLPLQFFAKSKYFNNIKDTFDRISNFEEKYKKLVHAILEAKERADELSEVYFSQGMNACMEKSRSMGSLFPAISFGNQRINLSSKRIKTALQDYITRYSELLETLKYVLEVIYNEPLRQDDSFNKYIARLTPTSKQMFDLSYFTAFNRHLWNKQKHRTDVSVSPIIITASSRMNPHIRPMSGSFNNTDIDSFIEESVLRMIELIKFIHSHFQSSNP